MTESVILIILGPLWVGDLLFVLLLFDTNVASDCHFYIQNSDHTALRTADSPWALSSSLYTRLCRPRSSVNVKLSRLLRNFRCRYTAATTLHHQMLPCNRPYSTLNPVLTWTRTAAARSDDLTSNGRRTANLMRRT